VPAVVPACVRTMAIFEVFATQQQELSNSDVARALGIAETSCLDLLHTLVQQGYLARTIRTRKFYPTRKLAALSEKIKANDPLQKLVNEVVESLVQKTAETALCGRINNGAVEVIAIGEGQHELRYIQHVGARIALNASALGKALLSLLPEDQAVEQIQIKGLKKTTPTTQTDLEKFLQSIRETRQRGWAAVYDEGTEGVGALAISGWIGDEMIAFSIAGLSDRLKKNEKIYLKALLDIKKQVFANESLPNKAVSGKQRSGN